MDLIGTIRELQESQGLSDDMITIVYEADIKWSLKEWDEYDYNDDVK